jgi:hypothetical protein
MIVHDLEQGTDEWFSVRLGIPTASRFADIYTSTGKVAAGQSKYMHTLAAEWLMGGKVETYQNEHMIRGNELEPEARAYYEFESGLDVEQTGFITTDDGLIGGSPDGLTEPGGLEIKCPTPQVHVEYLLAGKCPAKYYPQVQGLMFLTGKEHWDFMSYHPEMPQQLIVRVERDHKWITGFIDEIAKFNTKLLSMREKLAA